MKHLAIFALFVALAATAPTSKESNSTDDEILKIDDEFFPDILRVHTAEHEIIRLLYPLNKLNFDDDNEDSDDAIDQKIIFFVEADLQNGIEYKGLSVYKNNETSKILPSGTCAAAANDDSKNAYFGASDGLYKYNAKENSAEKYGPIVDSIIDIAKANDSDLIYILTDKFELFKVSEDASKKELVADVVGARQIVLDHSNNLYYYGEDKKPYVVSASGVKKVEGLPSDPSYIKLINPAFILDDGIGAVVDNKAYIIYVNGSSERVDIEFEIWPSAYSMEATLIQYYAHNKSIYEYNILVLILADTMEELKAFLGGKEDEIQSIATRSISDFSDNS